MDFEYPSNYLCPITLDLMIEPVKASDNNIYEKQAIVDWYKENKTSPLTREELFPEFILQTELQKEIKYFIKNFNIKVVPYETKNQIKFNCITCSKVLMISNNKNSISCNSCRNKYLLLNCKNCKNQHIVRFIRRSNFRCNKCGSINILTKIIN